MLSFEDDTPPAPLLGLQQAIHSTPSGRISPAPSPSPSSGEGQEPPSPLGEGYQVSFKPVQFTRVRPGQSLIPA